MGCCFSYHLKSQYSTKPNSLIFSPPKDCLYRIKYKKSINSQKTYTTCEFSHVNVKGNIYPWILTKSYILRKKDNNLLIILQIINMSISNEGYYFLFSGGSSNDLGTNLSLLIELSTHLKVNIIAYDYSGYGRSTGSPSEININNDINEVAEFAVKDLSINKSYIILFGFSLGTAPTLSLALNINYLTLAGIVLVSPISIEQTELNKNFLSIYDSNDIRSNYKKISDISCPIFLVHGLEDKANPANFSSLLIKKIKLLYRWFPKKGNNSNIFTSYRTKFLLKCGLYLEHLRDTKNNRLVDMNKSVIVKTKEIKIKENYLDNLDSKCTEADIDKETEKNKDEKQSYCSNDESLNDYSKNSVNSQRFSVVKVENESEVEDQLKLFKQIQKYGYYS